MGHVPLTTWGQRGSHWGYGRRLILSPPVLSCVSSLLPASSCASSPLWLCRFHDWRVDVDGKILAQGAATDAEQDMAVTLVFAQHLVNRGKHLCLMLGQGREEGREGGKGLFLMLIGGHYLLEGQT